jgi:hypothetical protein
MGFLQLCKHLALAQALPLVKIVSFRRVFLGMSGLVKISARFSHGPDAIFSLSAR